MISLKTDTHSHTVMSGHAYHTLQEMVDRAAQLGLEALAITDHGPAIPGAPTLLYFSNLKAVPREMSGVRLLRGAEVNVLDYDGTLDMPPRILRSLDIVIASVHDLLVQPGTEKEHTRLWRSVARNPEVDVIGHSGQHQYAYDYEALMPDFKRYGKLVEINSSSPRTRKGTMENCTRLAALCKRYGVPIVVGSDAHVRTDIARFDEARAMLAAVDFPEELIASRNLTALEAALERRRAVARSFAQPS